MKIAKLFAYLLLAIVLPFWLFLLSNNRLSESNKVPIVEVNLKQMPDSALMKYINTLSLNTEVKHVTFSPAEFERIFHAINGKLTPLKNTTASLENSSSQNYSTENEISKTKDELPIYYIERGGSFPVWEVITNKLANDFFLSFANKSLTDTIYVSRFNNGLNFELFGDDLIIPPNSQRAVKVSPSDKVLNETALFHIKGKLVNQISKDSSNTSNFEIDLLLKPRN